MSFLRLYRTLEPGTPPSDSVRQYFGNDRIMRIKDDLGNIRQLSLPDGGIDGNSLAWDSLSQAWIAAPQSINPRIKSEMFDDFIGATAAGDLNWRQNVSNGALSVNATLPISISNEVGNMRFTLSSTGATSRAGIDFNNNFFKTGGGEITLTSRVLFTPTFFNVADNMRFDFGIGSTGASIAGNANQTNGIHFSIRPTQVLAYCLDSGILTSQAIAVSLLSDQYYTFKITINAAGNSVLFEIYDSTGTVIGSFAQTVGIPPANAAMTPILLMNRTAAGALTTMQAYVDYFHAKQVFTTAR